MLAPANGHTGSRRADDTRGIELDDYPSSVSSPFLECAKIWRDAGWLGVIPLPEREKSPPPTNYTGNKSTRILFPSNEQISAWCVDPDYAHGNLGLALGWPVDVDGEQYQVIGVDVDDYESGGRTKTGGSQLKHLETQLGELPATVISSARTDGVSGIRFYLAPADAEFRGQADKAIEIIQRKHRYAVTWPSAYPLNPTTGEIPAGVVDDGRYHLYPPGVAPDGVNYRDEIASVTTLAKLPDAWVAYLKDAHGSAITPIDSASSPSELSDWATETFNNGDEGSACDEIRRNLAYWRAEIASDPTSHPKIRDAHWQIIKAAREGHTGWLWALEEIKAVYVADVADRSKRTYAELRGELFRSLTGALRKTKAAPGSHHVNPSCICAIETDGSSDDDNPLAVANREFWLARPELADIHSFAKCRRIGPWGLLGVALTRALASIPPEVVLPPILGTEASLNFYLALVGVSGGSKTVAIDAGESFVQTTPHIDSVMPGTGEGLAKQYAYVRGATRGSGPQQVGVRSTALLTVDEIGTLTALADRSGQTIMPTLRSAWSGADLGFGNGDPTKSPRVHRHRFRLAMVMGVQPDHAGPIFAEATLGTPQRFLWMPTHDDDMLGYDADTGDEPAPLVLPEYPERSLPKRVVAGAASGDRLGLLNTPMPSSALRRLSVPEVARRDVLEANEQRAKLGNWMRSDVVVQSMPSDIDGHLMLMREKVAVGLMRLAQRDGGFTDEDWHLAGMVMSVSNHTRECMQHLRNQRAKQETHGKATRAADFETAKAARIDANADQIGKIGDRIVARLETKDGQTTNRLFLAMFDANARTPDKRELFDGAIRNLLKGQRVKAEDFVANNGAETTKVWLA